MFFQTAKGKAVNVWRYSMIWLQSVAVGTIYRGNWFDIPWQLARTIVAVGTKDEKDIEEAQLLVINWTLSLNSPISYFFQVDSTCHCIRLNEHPQPSNRMSHEAPRPIPLQREPPQASNEGARASNCMLPRRAYAAGAV